MVTRPTLDEILRDPIVYTVLRREEMAVNGIGQRWRVLVSAWQIGWRLWLARGPWSVRPRWLRWGYWVGVPLGGAILVGAPLWDVPTMAASIAFWLPPLAGIVWRWRLRRFARQQVAWAERQQAERRIAEELVRLQSQSPSGGYDDPNRLKG